MAPTKYGKYVTREIIAESKYPEITAPIARYNGCRGGGDALVAEWSCITKPVVMDQEPEVDPDRDELILIGSTNLDDGADFHAEVEIALGPKGKKQVITEPAYIYIPKGYTHGPVTVKSVNKPIFVQSSRLAPQYSVGWDVKNESDCVSFILRKLPPLLDLPPLGDGPMPPDVTAIHPPDTPFRYIRLVIGKGLGYMLWAKDQGWPAKTSPMYGAGFYRDYCCLEPVHAHRESHQISMYIGGDPLDIEDFDASIDVYLGKETGTPHPEQLRRHPLRARHPPRGRRKKSGRQALHPDDVGHRASHGALHGGGSVRQGSALRRVEGRTHDHSWGARLRSADQDGRLGLALSSQDRVGRQTRRRAFVWQAGSKKESAR